MADPQEMYDDEGSSYGVPLAIAGAGVGAAGVGGKYYNYRKQNTAGYNVNDKTTKYDRIYDSPKGKNLKQSARKLLRKGLTSQSDADTRSVLKTDKYAMIQDKKVRKAFAKLDRLEKSGTATKVQIRDASNRVSYFIGRSPEYIIKAKGTKPTVQDFRDEQKLVERILKNPNEPIQAIINSVDNADFKRTTAGHTQRTSSDVDTWKSATATSNMEVDGLTTNVAEAQAKVDAVDNVNDAQTEEEFNKRQKDLITAKAELDEIQAKLDKAVKRQKTNQAGYDKHGDVPVDGSAQRAANDTIRAKDQTKKDAIKAKAEAKAAKAEAKAKATDQFTRDNFNRTGERIDLNRPASVLPKGSAKYLGTMAAGSLAANTVLDGLSGKLRGYADEASENKQMGPAVAAGTGAQLLENAAYLPGGYTAATAAGLGAGYVANQANRMYNIDPNGRYFDPITGQEITPEKTGFGGALKQGAGDIREAIYDNTVGKVKLANAFRKKISPKFMGGDLGEKYDEVKKGLDNNHDNRWTDKNKAFYAAHNDELNDKTGRAENDFNGRQHYINNAIQSKLDEIAGVRKSASTNIQNAEIDLTASETRLRQQTDLPGRKATIAKIKELKAEIARNNDVIKNQIVLEKDLINDRRILSTSSDSDLLNDKNDLTNRYVEGDNEELKKKFRSVDMGKATVSGVVNDFMTGVTDKLGQVAAATGAAATGAVNKGQDAVNEVVDNNKGIIDKTKAYFADKMNMSKNVAPDADTPAPDADTPDTKKSGRLKRFGGKLGLAEALNPGNILNAVEMVNEYLNAEDKVDYAAEKGGEYRDAGLDLLDRGVNRYNQYDEAWDNPNSGALLKEMAWNDLSDAAEGIVDYGKDFVSTGVKGAYNIGRGYFDHMAKATGNEPSDLPYLDMGEDGYDLNGRRPMDYFDPNKDYDNSPEMKAYKDRYDKSILSDDDKERLQDEDDLEREVALANSLPIKPTPPNRQGQPGQGQPGQGQVDPLDKYNSHSIGNYRGTPVSEADYMSREDRKKFGSAIYGDSRSVATPEYFDDRMQPDQVARREQVQAIEDTKYDYLPPSLRKNGAQFEQLSMKDRYDIIDKYQANTLATAKAQSDAAHQRYTDNANYAGARPDDPEARKRFDGDMNRAGQPLANYNMQRTALSEADGPWYKQVLSTLTPDSIYDSKPDVITQNEMLERGTPIDDKSGALKHQYGVDKKGVPEVNKYYTSDESTLDLLNNNKY